MLFIQKEGVYGHGIFWIGSDQKEGIEKCKQFSQEDYDDYHEWVLYLFVKQICFEVDPEHIELFRCKKTTTDNKGE